MEDIARRAFVGLGLARFAIDSKLDPDKVSEYYADEIAGYAARVESGEEDMGILVAEDEGAIAGHIVLEFDRKRTQQFGIEWGRLVSLAVDPDKQGRGTGKELVSAGLDWLSSRGVRYVEVSTDQNNIAAQRVYEDNGFRAIYSGISLSRKL